MGAASKFLNEYYKRILVSEKKDSIRIRIYKILFRLGIYRYKVIFNITISLLLILIVFLNVHVKLTNAEPVLTNIKYAFPFFMFAATLIMVNIQFILEHKNYIGCYSCGYYAENPKKNHYYCNKQRTLIFPIITPDTKCKYYVEYKVHDERSQAKLQLEVEDRILKKSW